MKDKADVLDGEWEGTPWMTTKYAGRIVNRHPATIRRWMKKEGLTAVCPGKGPFVIHHDDLKRFLAERER